MSEHRHARSEVDRPSPAKASGPVQPPEETRLIPANRSAEIAQINHAPEHASSRQLRTVSRGLPGRSSAFIPGSGTD